MPSRLVSSSRNRSVCHASSSSVRPLNVLPSMTCSSFAGSRAPRCRFDNQPLRRPCPHSAASTTRSRWWTGFTLSQVPPRRPASYGASTAFTTTPSCPRATASSKNAWASSASRVTSLGTQNCSGTTPSIAACRSAAGRSIRSAPSRWRTSKKNGVSGTSRRRVATSPRLAARLAVSWNGRGRPSGRSAIASPSRTIERTGSASATSTTSGTRSVIGSSVRVKTPTASPVAVHLDPHAVELPVDRRRLADLLDGALHRRGRLREHRLDGPADLQVEPLRARRSRPRARHDRPPGDRPRASPRDEPLRRPRRRRVPPRRP